jgi:hypothetical protein
MLRDERGYSKGLGISWDSLRGKMFLWQRPRQMHRN